jgi:hypothetical protein
MKASTLSLLLALALTACSPSAPASTPTAISLPTATAVSESTVAAAPTATTAAASGSLLEAILIGFPGDGSAITSPVTVSGQSRPTFEQNLVIAIYDEAGNQLALQPTTIAADAGSPGPFSAELTFSVDREQPGRVAVMEYSAMDGGLVHLTSTEVTLLPGGETDLVAQPIATENIAILFPLPNVEISGGSLTVTGFSEYYFESQLGLALCGGGDGSGAPDLVCGESSNRLALTVAMIDSPDIGQPGPFSGTLTWTVAEATPGRIVVYAESMRDGGITHLNSIPVLIQP